MSHKKGQGSTKNGRKSNAKRRGVKLYAGQIAKSGNIIIRQKGSNYECGKHTYTGRDFTVHSYVDGVVTFKKKKFTRFDGRKYLKTVVDVVPA